MAFCWYFILLIIAVGATTIFATGSNSDKNTTTTTRTATYDNKYDNIDLEEILKNDRLLRNYVKCLEFEGPCTPDGKMLRDTLPDAINSDCAKCTEKQKTGSEKVTHYLIDNYPELWERLEKIYNPEGNYRQAYLADKEQNQNTGNSHMEVDRKE